MKASLFPPRSSTCKSISQGCSCPSIHSFLFLPLLCQGSLTSGITYLKFNDLAVKGLLRKTHQRYDWLFSHLLPQIFFFQWSCSRGNSLRFFSRLYRVLYGAHWVGLCSCVMASYNVNHSKTTDQEQSRQRQEYCSVDTLEKLIWPNWHISTHCVP